MSFDLYVFVKEFPTGTIEKWGQELLHFGLACEFHPDFQTIEDWPGGVLSIKVTFTEKEYAETYGSQPFLVKFEFDVGNDLSLYDWVFQEDNLKNLSERVRQRLSQARKMAFFSMSAGGSLVDLHIQCFAAATLAFLCNGVLCDPQSEEYRVGDELIEGARREIQAYKPSKTDSQLRYFQSWED